MATGMTVKLSLQPSLTGERLQRTADYTMADDPSSGTLGFLLDPTGGAVGEKQRLPSLIQFFYRYADEPASTWHSVTLHPGDSVQSFPPSIRKDMVFYIQYCVMSASQSADLRLDL